ncbi:uncharacterized protein LOC141886740 isoform X3 [Acropora palmata]|uniref:uncharacterized protein LOC141886740 isoform X3 n=1 Tax=Acropora palmata TaxID=6131 RepID=UPI003DA189C0
MSYDDSDEVQSVADSVSSESEVNRSEEEWIKDSIQEEQTGNNPAIRAEDDPGTARSKQKTSKKKKVKSNDCNK